MILGIDASTSCTAASVIDKDKNILFIESWKLTSTKLDSLYKKVSFIREQLKELKKFDIKEIYIEEPLMNFKFGKTSAHTLSLLHRFNGIISNICYELFNIEPELINSGKARKLANVKKVSEKYKHAKNVPPKKIEALESLTAALPVLTVIENASGVIKTSEYDKIDSLVVAIAGLTLWQTKQKS